MTVDRIYFDMDGVLADFARGVRELCGIVAFIQGKEQDEAQDNRMWDVIRKVGHFYDRLALMPGAKEMFDRVRAKYGERCEILTGIPKPKRGILTAGEDKEKWMRRLLSADIRMHIVLREEKTKHCAGKGSILIDDLEENIREWEEKGGTGILHRSAKETLKELERLGLL